MLENLNEEAKHLSSLFKHAFHIKARTEFYCVLSLIVGIWVCFLVFLEKLYKISLNSILS